MHLRHSNARLKLRYKASSAVKELEKTTEGLSNIVNKLLVATVDVVTDAETWDLPSSHDNWPREYTQYLRGGLKFNREGLVKAAQHVQQIISAAQVVTQGAHLAAARARQALDIAASSPLLSNRSSPNEKTPPPEKCVVPGVPLNEFINQQLESTYSGLCMPIPSRIKFGRYTKGIGPDVQTISNHLKLSENRTEELRGGTARGVRWPGVLDCGVSKQLVDSLLQEIDGATTCMIAALNSIVFAEKMRTRLFDDLAMVFKNGKYIMHLGYYNPCPIYRQSTKMIEEATRKKQKAAKAIGKIKRWMSTREVGL